MAEGIEFPLQFRLDERLRERDRARREVARRLKRRRRHRVFVALRIAYLRENARRLARARDHFTMAPGGRASVHERHVASRRIDAAREALQRAERLIASRRGNVRKFDHDVVAARERLLALEVRVDSLASMRADLLREHRRVERRKESAAHDERELMRRERLCRMDEGKVP